jgi:ATP-dependent RNA helicase RhlE
MSKQFARPSNGRSFNSRSHGPRNTSRGGHRSGGSYGGGSRGGFRKKPNTISHDKFVNKTVDLPPSTEAVRETQAKFADFNFQPAVAANIADRGYETPTPIQEQTIHHLLAGRDVVGLANTGTGKTAAFALPIINSLITDNKPRNAHIIIAPTRELAHQINDEFKLFSKGMKLYSVVCVGGENIHRQKSELRRGVSVIIGTPGRLKDLLQQGELKLDAIKSVVLDEADQMLDMGFLPDMQFILQSMPQARQVVCFSATMTPSIERLLAGIQNDAVLVSTVAKVSSRHIDQDIISARSKEEKITHILNMLNQSEYQKVLVFGETKFGVQRLADELAKSGHNTQAIHGNKTQSQRKRALSSFKTSDNAVLVATDVAARGLDIPNVHLVINFDLPQTHETYIHRIGRTGRAGKPGVARTFV